MVTADVGRAREALAALELREWRAKATSLADEALQKDQWWPLQGRTEMQIG